MGTAGHGSADSPGDNGLVIGGRNNVVGGRRALHELKLLIVRGQLMPGEQIRQEETAESLGISRVKLREALHALAEQGILEHRPHQGYFVAKRAPMELAQVLLMLTLLEPELMRTVEWPSDQVLSELEDLNQQMADLVDDWDWLPMLALNRDFHFRVFRLSPYTLVLQEVERLWGLADPFISHKLSLPEGRRRTVAEHQAIIDALRANDRDACVSALDAHRSSSHAGLSPALPIPRVREDASVSLEPKSSNKRAKLRQPTVEDKAPANGARR